MSGNLVKGLGISVVLVYRIKTMLVLLKVFVLFLY